MCIAHGNFDAKACASNPNFTTGYREAASLTRQKRTEHLFSALSRTSSTVSLLDVKTEEPPISDNEEKQKQNMDGEILGETLGSSSSRLLFGRPPIKKLLRRSTRAALKDSISYRVKKTLNREYLLVGRAYESEIQNRNYTYLRYLLFFIGVLILLASCYDTILSVYVAFQALPAGLQSSYS